MGNVSKIFKNNFISYMKTEKNEYLVMIKQTVESIYLVWTNNSIFKLDCDVLLVQTLTSLFPGCVSLLSSSP